MIYWVWLFFRVLWTGPTTAVGLVIAIPCMPLGARWRQREGGWECSGGALARLLEHGTVLEGGALAITFGEVILGRSAAALDLTRKHEHVHVRQARRWGAAFIPAYLLASLWVFFRGGRGYRDNPFEREAFGVSDGRERK